MDAPLSVLGTPLKPCSHAPVTGWFRDGCCNTDPSDRGSHTVCAVLTEDFLECLREMGNDLVTSVPEHDFPGLTAGDRWCVCAASWAEAARRSRACPVDLEATHARALRAVSLDVLMAHATGGIEA